MFSGRATSINATIGGINVILNDTGDLPPNGGFIERELASADLFGGTLTTGLLTAITQGGFEQSRSQVIVYNLNLMLGGNTFASDVFAVSTQCTCQESGPPICDGGVFANFRINGEAFPLGPINQRVELPGAGGGFVIFNEQIRTVSGSSASLTINGVHIIIPDNPIIPGDQGANIIFSSAHSDINCSQ